MSTVHLLAALALFGIVRRTLTVPALKGRFDPKAATAIAFSAALIWLLHPLQTEAVTYIVQRSESLMGLFYLLTLYCFIRSASSARPVRWHAAAVACCLLGMASKEVMISAPLVVLLYDRIFFTGSVGETLWRRRGFYLGLAATWLVLGRSLGEAVGAHAVSAGFTLPQATPLEYARSEFDVILHYLRLAFLPVGLCLDYDWPIAKGIRDIAPGAVVVGGLLAATTWALARQPATQTAGKPMWGFAGAWFFLVLAPTSSIMPIRDLAFEHRMYLPLAALIVPATVAAYLLIQRLMRRPTEPEAALGRAGSVIAIALVVAIAGAFGTLTFLRNRDYRSAIAIWKDTTGKRKDNARAWTSLGDAYLNAGDCGEAIRCLSRAIELQPRWSWHYSSRATAYLRLRRGDEAMRDCDTAIAMEPAFARAWFIRGSVYFQTRRFDEAIRNFSRAIELDPNNFDAVYNRGKAYASLNDLRDAIRDFDRAIELLPRSALSYFNRGSAYALVRRPDRAVGDFARAVELKPDFAEAYNGRGQALTDSRSPDGGARRFRQSDRVEPELLGGLQQSRQDLRRVEPRDRGGPRFQQGHRVEAVRRGAVLQSGRDVRPAQRVRQGAGGREGISASRRQAGPGSRIHPGADPGRRTREVARVPISQLRAFSSDGDFHGRRRSPARCCSWRDGPPTATASTGHSSSTTRSPWISRARSACGRSGRSWPARGRWSN